MVGTYTWIFTYQFLVGHTTIDFINVRVIRAASVQRCLIELGPTIVTFISIVIPTFFAVLVQLIIFLLPILATAAVSFLIQAPLLATLAICATVGSIAPSAHLTVTSTMLVSLCWGVGHFDIAIVGFVFSPPMFDLRVDWLFHRLGVFALC
ncbi:hypothetical protein FRC08_001737 [Ceratobasidium sp. 394]|nr:hypothetical protein FRC08_001737 [Ceratobasidium sp. 394]